MRKIIEKLFGIDKLKEEAAKAATEALRLAEDAKKQAEESLNAAAAAKMAEELAKLGPKERANANKEPYVAVLETHVNDQNPRNGFFELDWNEHFIVQLKSAGYYGDTDEEIVDKWFQDLCRGIGSEEGVSMDRRGSGYINVQPLANGKSEIS